MAGVTGHSEKRGREERGGERSRIGRWRSALCLEVRFGKRGLLRRRFEQSCLIGKVHALWEGRDTYMYLDIDHYVIASMDRREDVWERECVQKATK